MSISHAIEVAFEKKRVRGWEKFPRLFVAIDLHDVIIPGTYTLNNDGRQFYPYAKEVLQWLTRRKDMCLILFTSSHKKQIEDVRSWMKQDGIVFDYANENPECPNNELCDFSKKWFMDIMLEDKAGFESGDWLEIKETLIKIGEWDKKDSH